MSAGRTSGAVLHMVSYKEEGFPRVAEFYNKGAQAGLVFLLGGGGGAPIMCVSGVGVGVGSKTVFV